MMLETFIPVALKTVLGFEEKGKIFYNKTAEMAEDILSQKLFQTLAENEAKQVEKIRLIYDAVIQNRSVPKVNDDSKFGLEEIFKHFFEVNKNDIAKDEKKSETYLFAIEMEKTGIEIYQKFSEQTDHQAEKEFYGVMIRKERKNLEALKNIHFFLTDSGNWFEEEGSRRWEWLCL